LCLGVVVSVLELLKTNVEMSDDEQQTPLGDHLSQNVNQDVDSVVQDIANIRLSQDLFDSSTPVPGPGSRFQGSGSAKKKSKQTKPHSGILHKQPKPAKQNVFKPSSSAHTSGSNNSSIEMDKEQMEQDNANRISAAMYHNAKLRNLTSDQVILFFFLCAIPGCSRAHAYVCTCSVFFCCDGVFAVKSSCV